MNDERDSRNIPKGIMLDMAAAEADNILDAVDRIVDTDPEEYFRLIRKTQDDLTPLREELRGKKDVLQDLRKNMHEVSLTLEELTQQEAVMTEAIESGRVYEKENELKENILAELERYNRLTENLNNVIQDDGTSTGPGGTNEHLALTTSPSGFTEEDVLKKSIIGRLKNVRKNYLKATEQAKTMIDFMAEVNEGFESRISKHQKDNEMRIRNNPSDFIEYSSPDRPSVFDNIGKKMCEETKTRLSQARETLFELAEVVTGGFTEFLQDTVPQYLQAKAEREAFVEKQFEEVKLKVYENESELEELELHEEIIINEMDKLNRVIESVYTSYQEALYQNAPAALLRMGGYVPTDNFTALPQHDYESEGEEAETDDGAIDAEYVDTTGDDSEPDAEITVTPVAETAEETPAQVAPVEDVVVNAEYVDSTAEVAAEEAAATSEERDDEFAEKDGWVKRVYTIEHDEEKENPALFTVATDFFFYKEMKKKHGIEFDYMIEAIELETEMLDYLMGGESIVPPPAEPEAPVTVTRIKSIVPPPGTDEEDEQPEEAVQYVESPANDEKEGTPTDQPIAYQVPANARPSEKPPHRKSWSDMARGAPEPPVNLYEEEANGKPSMGLPPTDPEGVEEQERTSDQLKAGEDPWADADAMLRGSSTGEEYLRRKKAANGLAKEDTAAPFDVPEEVKRHTLNPNSFGEPRLTQQVERNPQEEMRSAVKKRCEDNASIEDYIWSIDDSSARARPIIYTVEEDKKTQLVSKRVHSALEKVLREKTPTLEELSKDITASDFKGRDQDIYVFSPGKYFLTALCFIHMSSASAGLQSKLMTEEVKFAMNQFMKKEEVKEIDYFNKLEEIAPFLGYRLILKMTESLFNEYNIVTESEMTDFSHNPEDFSSGTNQLLTFRKALNHHSLKPRLKADPALEENYKLRRVVIGNLNIGNMYDIFTTLAGTSTTFNVFTELNSDIKLPVLKKDNVTRDFMMDLQSCFETAWINYYYDTSNKFKEERYALIDIGGTRIIPKRIFKTVMDMYQNKE